MSIELGLKENIEDIRNNTQEVTDRIQAILDGNVPITSLSDLIGFIETLIDLIRGLLNALLSSGQVGTVFFKYIVDITQNILDIILENKNIIEGIILILPALPFIYLLSQIVSSF